MKTHFTLLLLLLCLVAKAQTTSPENRIVVLGEASIEVPADQVKVNVFLESTDSTSIDKMYQRHRELESKMVKLLQELQVPSSDIHYSLLAISKRQDYADRKRVQYYMGRQTVIFTLNSIEKLPEIQARLIKEGISSFNSAFTSTQLKKHQTEVLEKAVEVAREKADVLAKASGRSIKRILKVADTEDTDPAFRNYRAGVLEERMVVSYAASNLMSFPQSIPVSAAVKVVFELK